MTAPCDVLKNLPKRPIAFLAFQKWKTTLEVMINEGGGAKFEVCVFVNFYFYFTKLICTTFRNDFQNCSLRTALKFTQTAYSLNLNILNTSMYSTEDLRESKINVSVTEIIRLRISCCCACYV